MVAREASPRAVDHPYVRRLITSGGLACFVNQVTGGLSFREPEAVPDVRGGFFCDEPVRPAAAAAAAATAAAAAAALSPLCRRFAAGRMHAQMRPWTRGEREHRSPRRARPPARAWAKRSRRCR